MQIHMQVKRRDLKGHIIGCAEIRFSFIVGKRKEELRDIEYKIRKASNMDRFSVEKMQVEIHKLNEQVESLKAKFQLVQRYWKYYLSLSLQ